MVEDQQNKALNVIVNCLILNDNIDELKGTNYYFQDIKQLSNRLIKLLEKKTDSITNELWGVDEKTMIQLLRDRDEVIKKIANLNPEKFSKLSNLIDSL